MERKAYLQLAATKAKNLKPGQMIRITAGEKYFVMRDVDGKLYIGQSFVMQIEGETSATYTPFFEKRPSLPQYRDSDGALMGYWQKFMPNREEASKHGVNPDTLAKWKVKK